MSQICSDNLSGTMNLKIEVLFFISLIGAFNSFLLSFFFIRKKNISAYFFASLLFFLGIRIGKSVLLYFYSDTPKIVLQIGLSACLFIGPALYFFLKAEIYKVKTIPRSWKIILCVLALFILIVGFTFPYQRFPAVWNTYIVNIIYAFWGGFVLSAGFLLFPADLKRISSSQKWLIVIFIGNLFIYLAYLAALLLPFRSIYISAAVTFSTIFYSLLAVVLLQRKKVDLFNNDEKSAGKKLEVENAEEILNQLHLKMSTEKLYLNPNLKLSDVASEVNITTHHLSHILNNSLGKKFSEFINEYRIDEACLLLFTHENLSIDGIGYEVGFNSRSTFFAAFKKYKGVTPATFQQKNSKNSTVL